MRMFHLVSDDGETGKKWSNQGRNPYSVEEVYSRSLNLGDVDDKGKLQH